MKGSEALPEIFCDFNARMTERGYSLERAGSIESLGKLGLSLDQAVGKRFLFNGGADIDEKGEPADIICSGIIVRDPQWGYLAVADAGSFFRRRTLPAQQLSPLPPTPAGLKVSLERHAAPMPRPITVSIVGWFLIAGALSAVLPLVVGTDSALIKAVYGLQPQSHEQWVTSAFLLICGIFLLRGANWARWLYLGMLGLGTVAVGLLSPKAFIFSFTKTLLFVLLLTTRAANGFFRKKVASDQLPPPDDKTSSKADTASGGPAA